MSERETKIKSLVLSVIGGINERNVETELQADEYTSVLGVFPEFAGLQSRIFGKRLLKKYALPIYGIHQFWTPQGYGGGLYQFDGTIDYGQWLTPISVFNLSLPSISIDAGGMSLDIFGYSYGSNFGYNESNTCSITYTPTGTGHQSCLPSTSPANTPNDNNGGPAGQGRKCAWQQTLTNYIAAFDSFVTSAKYGVVASDTIIGHVPPITLPIPSPSAPVIPYTPQVGPPWSVYAFAGQQLSSDTDASNDAHQYINCQAGKIVFDFAAVQTLPGFVGMTITLQRDVLTVGLTSTAITEYPISSGEFSFANYFSTLPSVRSIPTGFQQSLQTFPIALTAYFRKRVCT